MSFPRSCLSITQNGSVDAIKSRGDDVGSNFLINLMLIGLLVENFIKCECMLLSGLSFLDGNWSFGYFFNTVSFIDFFLVEGSDSDKYFDIFAIVGLF